MDRRSYIGLVASITLAGCSGSGTTDTEAEPADRDQTATVTDRPSAVDLSATDVSAKSPDVSLSVAYAARVTDQLDTNPPTRAEAGYKWLIVDMAVTNTGDKTRELTSHQYVVESGGETYDPVVTKTDSDLDGKRVPAGETVEGQVVFHVRDRVAEAVLTVREETRRSFSVSFERR